MQIYRSPKVCVIYNIHNTDLGANGIQNPTKKRLSAFTSACLDCLFRSREEEGERGGGGSFCASKQTNT